MLVVGRIDCPGKCPHCPESLYAQAPPVAAPPSTQPHGKDNPLQAMGGNDWQDRYFHDKQNGCKDSISLQSDRTGDRKHLPDMLSAEEQRLAEERDECDKPRNQDHRLTHPERAGREKSSAMQAPVDLGPRFGSRNVSEVAARHSIHQERNATHGPCSRASSYG